MPRFLHRGPFVAVLAVLLVAAACGDDAEPSADSAATSTTAAAEVPDRGNVNGVLELGHLAPQTGPMEAVVSSVTEAVRIGVDEINDGRWGERRAGRPGRARRRRGSRP